MAISKEPEKKLKRGLQDISPLFQIPVPSIPDAIPSVPDFFDPVQFVTVCVPDHEGDAFFANAYLASQVVRRTPFFASLVSIAPGFNALPSQSTDPFPSLEFLDPRISRLALSHQELWTFSQNGPPGNGSKTPRPADSLPPCLVFLEFEPAHFRSLARIALLLDRVILFVQPLAESLRETYRLIKIFWSYNRQIQFFLLFRGKTSSERLEEFLFERFSLITSRFLGLYPEWLGDLDFSEKSDRLPLGSGSSPGFNPEALLSREGLPRPLSPEKNRFWQELQGALRTQFSPERIS